MIYAEKIVFSFGIQFFLLKTSHLFFKGDHLVYQQNDHSESPNKFTCEMIIFLY